MNQPTTLFTDGKWHVYVMFVTVIDNLLLFKKCKFYVADVVQARFAISILLLLTWLLLISDCSTAMGSYLITSIVLH